MSHPTETFTDSLVTSRVERKPSKGVRAPKARPSSLRHQALAIPNLVTYARIAAVPVVMLVMQYDSRANAIVATVIFVLAALTDALDGYLARRLNQVSVIGKFLDPLADKLIVLGCLVMLLQLGRVSPWLVFLLISREIVIGTLRTIAIGEGVVIAARRLGKWKTGFQMVGIAALLVHYDYPMAFLGLSEPVSFNVLGTYVLWVGAALSVLSAVDYFWGFFRGLSGRSLPLGAGDPHGEG